MDQDPRRLFDLMSFRPPFNPSYQPFPFPFPSQFPISQVDHVQENDPDLQNALEQSLRDRNGPRYPNDMNNDRWTNDRRSFSPRDRYGHRNIYDESLDSDPTEDVLKMALEQSKREKELLHPHENREKWDNNSEVGETEDDILDIALSQSMEDEKLRQEEKARAEEEARAKEEELLEKQHQEEMELERALLLSKEQEERDARQRLLEEQDQAYQESLARDKAKEEQQRQEEERLRWAQLTKEREEEERELADAIHLSETLSHMTQKERDIRRRLGELSPEPEASDPSAVHLVFQLPSGIRIERFFRLNNTFAEVKLFVDSRSLEEFGKCSIPEHYNLVTDFPRRVWDNLGLRLNDAGFRKRQLLRVEEVKM